MGTTALYPTTTDARNLAAQIERWRENLIDLDIVVDDRRREIDRAVDAFRVAVRERDRAVVHLAHLESFTDDDL